ncbi:MAG: hypothetical protein OSJ70_08355 [Bacilli bacterium]|nr:hypothetical protein [Bacilli bacterium]
MKDTKEIVLFFKEESSFKPLDVAKEISSRYPELGNPIIIPESDNKSLPVIIFNENPDLQMQVSLKMFTVVMNHSYFESVSSIVFDIVDAFSEFNVEFGRIGYIASVFLSPKYIEKAKKKYLNGKLIGEVTDFNFSWYKRLECSFGSINCWERIIVDKNNFKDLLCQFDFNTLASDVISLEIKKIKEFFKLTNEYIEDRVDL